MVRERELIIGGVYIPKSAITLDLLDILDGSDTTQNLVDQANMGTQATLYIPLNKKVRNLEITSIKYGYVDATNVDNLTDLYILEGSSADDDTQQRKCIYHDNAVAETPITSTGNLVFPDEAIPVHLDEPGKLYFITNWSTLLAGAATDWFYLVVYGRYLFSNKLEEL